MKIKFTWFIALVAVVALCLTGQALAQGKGHAGGLGEERIQLNYASPVNLAKAPGITPEIAEAICKYRDEQGAFIKPEDLKNVPGITEEVYKELNPQVGTEGDVYALPKPGETLEEEDEDAPLAPSKC